VHEAPFQKSLDTPSSPIPILGFARALSAATNAASGEREDMIGLEALFLGPTQTRLAILAARKNGSHSPEFFSEHERHLVESSSQDSVGLVQKIMTLNRLRTLEWPLHTQRGISSRFGPRLHPVKGQNHFHNGIDLRAPSGEEVGAIHSGMVSAATENRFNGKFVRVDHGLGMESLYCHLSQMNVAQGDYVEEFQTIGEVGQTGQVTGPHLHYTLKIDGVPVNPLHYGFSIQPPSPHLPVVHPKALRPQTSLPPNS
jgi:murein DD-endopeptidase MepM/ murein hydrolase activator NlpD